MVRSHIIYQEPRLLGVGVLRVQLKTINLHYIGTILQGLYGFWKVRKFYLIFSRILKILENQDCVTRAMGNLLWKIKL